MLDRSSKLDDSLMDAYRSIHEVHKGHAAGESDIEKQASQLASDIRYKAKGRIRDGMNSEDKKRIYLKLLASSPAPGIVKNKAKRKLLGESVELVETPYSGKGIGRRENIRKNPIGLDQSDPAARQKVSNTAKKVVRGGEKVARRVAKGVIGIAKREGTLSQKVTGAAIDAVKGRVGNVGSKVKSAGKSVSDWAHDRKPKSSSTSSSSKSETASSYKTRSAKKKVDLSKPGDKSGPTIDLKKKQGTTNTYEGLSNWRKDLLGEEGYDKWRDKHLEHGGIGAVGSKSPSRPYTRSEKQPKGDTAYQKEMKAKHGGKLPSAVDVVRARIEKESGKGAIMKNEETSAADKIINNIRSQRVDEGKLVHGPFGPYITGQKMPKEQREVPLRKVPYEDINSAMKAVGEEKERYDNTKSPDYKKKKAALAKKHGGYDKIKGHPQFEDYHSGQGEKIQKRTKKWMDKMGLEGAPGLNAMKARTAEHEKKRGVKEEVGVSSSAAMIKARKEAELKSKEEAAVKKAKKAKNEEVALENRMASHTAGMSDAQKDSASNTISKGAAYKMGRRTDAAAFGDRKKSGKRGNPQQYRKSADSPEWEGRFPYGKSNIRQGKGSIKDLKNEYSPAVEKVIEAIKINKASPKSPNCIIMPKKDDITDKAGGNGKKSTKNVVSKKQKQFFNQEGKTYSSFLKEYLSTLTKAAAGQAAKGAITTTAKTVGKETLKQGVKQGGKEALKQGTTQTAANAITKTGKSLGAGKLAKTTSSAITQVSPKAIDKVKPKTTAIVKADPKAIAKRKSKVTTLAKSGTKTTAIQTATQTAIDKVGNKKPPTTAEKEPQKQGNQSKGFDFKGPELKKIKTNAQTITSKNQQ